MVRHKPEKFAVSTERFIIFSFYHIENWIQRLHAWETIIVDWLSTDLQEESRCITGNKEQLMYCCRNRSNQPCIHFFWNTLRGSAEVARYLHNLKVVAESNPRYKQLWVRLSEHIVVKQWRDSIVEVDKRLHAREESEGSIPSMFAKRYLKGGLAKDRTNRRGS